MYTQGGAVIGSIAATPGTPPTMTIYDHQNNSLGSAWILSDAIESVSLSPNASSSETMNYDGNIVAVHWSGEYLEASFRIRPFAPTGVSDVATRAALVKTAYVLRFGYTAVVTGMPVIAAPPFTDALNVTTGDPGGNRWIVTSNALEISASSPAGRTISFRRYPKIVGGVATTT